MKTVQELKKGDIVVTYTHRGVNECTDITEEKVISIGAKFIGVSVGTSDRKEKFTIEGLCGKDWCARQLFLGTKEEFEEYRNASEIGRLLKQNIERRLRAVHTNNLECLMK